MQNFNSLFTTFEATDIPPIQNAEYLKVKSEYDLFFHPTIIGRNNSFLQDIQFDNKFSTLYPDITESIKTQDKPQLNVTPKRYSGSNYNKFIKDLKKYQSESGDVMDNLKIDTLTKFAKLESNFGQTRSNPVSSALGYFLVIRGNRKDLGSDITYAADPDLQFKAASRLYDEIRSKYSDNIQKGKLLGLSDFLIMYGYWFNPSSMNKYIASGGKSDGFADGQGTTLLTILKKAKQLE